MRLYDISCDRCEWRAEFPVDERVADYYREKKLYCLTCEKQEKVQRPYTIKERIVVGLVGIHYFTLKEGGSDGGN